MSLPLPVYLEDFSHEASPDEATMFYFFYFIIQLYVVASLDFILSIFLGLNSLPLKEKIIMEVVLFLLFPAIIPSIFCSIICAIIMIKKRITDQKILVIVIVSMIFTCFLPNCLGMFLGLLMPSFLMAMSDNNVEKYDKILKLQLAEHDRKIEAQLEKEQMIKEMHKSNDRINNIIHLELTPDDEDEEENKFHLFD